MSQNLSSAQQKDLKRRAQELVGLEEERIEAQTEVKRVKERIADAYDQASNAGWNKQALAQVVEELMQGPEERQLAFEFEDVVASYRHALGLLPEEEAEVAVAGAAHPVRVGEARAGEVVAL